MTAIGHNLHAVVLTNEERQALREAAIFALNSHLPGDQEDQVVSALRFAITKLSSYEEVVEEESSPRRG
jgi:hypothetical protein